MGFFSWVFGWNKTEPKPKTKSDWQIAYEEGWKAFESGVGEYSNPFQGYPLWGAWEEGYANANNKAVLKKMRGGP